MWALQLTELSGSPDAECKGNTIAAFQAATIKLMPLDNVDIKAATMANLVASAHLATASSAAQSLLGRVENSC